jgi:glycosyltransferase involved in cell wall biosynthesis
MLKGKLSVIMPAYKESAYIESNLCETVETLTSFGYEFEVIVVDDGSPDHTEREATKARARYPGHVRVVRYDRNQGKGNALLCGFVYSKGDVIVFLDADMDLHPVQLPGLLEMLTVVPADVVIGSKRHPNSNVNYPLVRRIYSMAYYTVIRLLFGLPVRDTQTGMKVFRRTVLEAVVPRILAKRFAFDIELLANAHRLGFKIVDAPITLNFQRKFGRIGLSDVRNIVLDTLAIFYRMHIIRYYDRMGHVKLETTTFASREVDRNSEHVESAV